MKIKKFVFLVLTFILTSCVTQQYSSPQSIHVSGDYKQESTGLTFPEIIQNFRRVALTRFDEKAMNIGVGYNHLEMPIVLTLYSYPAPEVLSIGSPPEVIAAAKKVLFDNAYEENKQSILVAHPNSQFISEESYTVSGMDGMYALFTYSENFAGSFQKVSSRLYLFQRGDALIKYRISTPESINATNEINQFITNFVLKPVSHN